MMKGKNMTVQEILAEQIAFEQWLEQNDEGYAYAKRKYRQAQTEQVKADNSADANYWDRVRLKWADEMADIRTVMKDTYESKD